jgi:trimeric autotransporter adhesin
MKSILFGMALTLASVSWAETNYSYFINTAAGKYPLGNGGPATAALLESPRGVAVDGSGNIYVGDSGNAQVRRILAGTGNIGQVFSTSIATWGMTMDSYGNLYITDGTYQVYKLNAAGDLSVIAGAGQGFGGDGGSATAALLRYPYGVAVDAAGNVYIADGGNQRIRKIGRDGIIRTVAGTGSSTYNGDGIAATAANLNGPRSIAVDSAGALYIAEYGNHRIRKIAADGTIGTIAGTGTNSTSGDGGLATKATLQYPIGLTLDAAGNLYFSDMYRIRKISTDGTIQTVAGTGVNGYSGDGGAATSARIDPYNLTVDASGNLLVADYTNSRIRSIAANGTIKTIAGTSHVAGDGGAATEALMRSPYDVAFDPSGNLYIADAADNRVRKVTPGGVISTYAGNGDATSTTDSGVATEVGLSGPRGLVTDAAGNLYIADYGNCRVRRVAPSGALTTVAGTGSCLDSGDGGPATAARLSPWSLAMDPAGNLYISDPAHSRVRKVTPAGTISTVAGDGYAGTGDDGIAATESELYIPYGLAIDKDGTLLIADSGNHRVRRVNADGTVSNVAGNGGAYIVLYDNVPAKTTALYAPYGLAVDGQGNLFITQASYGLIRKVDAAGNLHTIAGVSGNGFSGDGGQAAYATMNYPRGLAPDANGDIYFADTSNHRVRKLTLNSPASLDITSGNNQSAPTEKAVPDALVAHLTGRVTGVPFVQVKFAVTSGTATVYQASSNTDSQGTAYANVILGKTAGAVRVTVTADGVAPAVFTLNALDPSAVIDGGAMVASGGIVGAGLSVPAVKEISANGVVSLYGDGFAPAGTQRGIGASDLVDGKLPTKLAGVCVQVGKTLAPVLAVYPKQINIQVPYGPLSAETTVQVIKNCGEAGELRGNMQTVTMRYATPEFYYFALNASGKNPIAAVDAATGVAIGASRAAKPGDTITLYGTGFGATSAPLNAGEIPTKAAKTVLPASVTIGTTVLDRANILYAGVSPYSAGLYQINILIPDGVADGDQPVTLKLGQYSTPAGGYLTVKR